jgi:hypothetical protein
MEAKVNDPIAPPDVARPAYPAARKAAWLLQFVIGPYDRRLNSNLLFFWGTRGKFTAGSVFAASAWNRTPRRSATSASRRLQPSGSRKYRSLLKGAPNESNRPERTFSWKARSWKARANTAA